MNKAARHVTATLKCNVCSCWGERKTNVSVAPSKPRPPLGQGEPKRALPLFGRQRVTTLSRMGPISSSDTELLMIYVRKVFY